MEGGAALGAGRGEIAVPVPSMFMGSADAADPLLRQVVAWVPPGSLHVDLGCGRGRLLELSAAGGNRVLGFDSDAASVEHCRGLGIEARLADATRALDDLPGPAGAISAIHLVEHLAPPDVDELLGLTARRLQAGGRLAVVTPNFRDWRVASETFWLDPTHVRPYPIPLLEAMAARHGLVTVKTARLLGLRRRYRLKARLLAGRAVFGTDFGKMNALAVFELPRR